MSYATALKCLADLQQYAPPATKPIEYDLAAALSNIVDAVQSDFLSVHSALTALKNQLEDLEREVQRLHRKQ